MRDDTYLPAYAPALSETSAFTQQPAKSINYGLVVDSGLLYQSAAIAGFGFTLGAFIAVVLLGLLYLAVGVVFDVVGGLLRRVARALA